MRRWLWRCACRAQLERACGQRLAATGREQRLVRLPLAFAQPSAEDRVGQVEAAWWVCLQASAPCPGLGEPSREQTGVPAWLSSSMADTAEPYAKPQASLRGGFSAPSRWIAPRRSGVRVPLAPSPGIRGLYPGFGRLAVRAGRAVEGVGDRVLEAQRAAFARGGVPRVGAVACAGGLEERRVEPGVDGVVGLAVAVCGCGADEARGAVVVAVDCGDRGKAGRPSDAKGRTTSSRQSVSSSRNASRAASVSPVSSAASPKLPRRSIQMNGSSSPRAIGVARATNSFASRSLPSTSAP